MAGSHDFHGYVGLSDESNHTQILQTPNAYALLEYTGSQPDAKATFITICGKIHQLLSISNVGVRDFYKIWQSYQQGLKSLVILINRESALQVVVLGHGSVILKRHTTYASLLSKAGDASGQLQPHDRIIAQTVSVQQCVSQDTLISLMGHDHLIDKAKGEQYLHEKRCHGSFACYLESQNMVLSKKVPPHPHRNIALWTTLRTKLRWNSSHALYPNIQWSRSTRRFIIMLLVSIIFVASIGYGVYRQVSDGKRLSAQSRIRDATALLDEAKALTTLNPLKANESLSHAKELTIEVYSFVSENSKESRQAKILEEEINRNMDKTLQLQRVTLQTYYDPSLLSLDATISSFTLIEDTMLAIVDGRAGKTYAIGIPNKSAILIGGGKSFIGAYGIAGTTSTLYTLLPQGIHSSRIEDKKTTEFLIRRDDAWKEVQKMVSYGANIYLLDEGNARIWKYVGTEGGAFGERTEYLNPDEFPTLPNITSFVIDGSVWMGTDEGSVLKFSLGKQDTFKASGGEMGLGKWLLVYTTDTSQRLYILDRDNKRMVVNTKEGQYVAQYVWNGGGDVVSFAVSESQQIALLLMDGNLWSFPL